MHVFVSYSRDDQAYVGKLVGHLRARGLAVWVDGDLDYGDRWTAAIEKAIQQCAAVAVVMSPSAKESTWVDREIRLAEALGKPVLPLLLAGSPFWHLGNVQFTSVVGGVLPPDGYVTRLRALLGSAPAADARRQDRAVAAILEIAGIADECGLTAGDALRAVADDIRTRTVALLLLGGFSNGKTTLLNAILGDTTTPVDLGGHLLPVSVLPSTALPTWVRYATTPSVTAVHHDGRRETWSPERFRREGQLAGGFNAPAGIAAFEVGYPARLCEDGAVLGDTPGLNARPEAAVAIRAAASGYDAAIVVWDSMHPMAIAEQRELAELQDPDRPIFIVVNLRVGIDDEWKAHLWNRYVRDRLGGEDWHGQDFAARDIFLVDAAAAQRGRLGGDEGAVAASGLIALEARLRSYVADTRISALTRCLGRAAAMAANLDDGLAERRLATENATHQRLLSAERQAASALRALTDVELQLSASVAGRLSRAEGRLSVGFERLISSISAEIPDVVEAAWRSRPATLTVSTVPITEAFVAHVQQRLRTWCARDVAATTHRLLDELVEEIVYELGPAARGGADGPSAPAPDWSRVVLSVQGAMSPKRSAELLGALAADAYHLEVRRRPLVPAETVLLPTVLALGVGAITRRNLSRVFDKQLREFAPKGREIIRDSLRKVWATWREVVDRAAAGVVAEGRSAIDTWQRQEKALADEQSTDRLDEAKARLTARRDEIAALLSE